MSIAWPRTRTNVVPSSRISGRTKRGRADLDPAGRGGSGSPRVVSAKRDPERRVARRRPGIVEGIGKTLQNRVCDAHLQEVLVGGADVVRIWARNARALAHVAQEVGIREPTGILRVMAIHHVGHG